MNNLAFMLSRIFDPVVEIPLLLALAVLYAYFNGYEWQYLFVLLFIDAFLPFLFFYSQLKRHIIHDWDITNRKERYPLYGFTLAAHLAGVLMTFLFGQIAVGKILLVFWTLALAFFVITLFWKISVHAGVNAAMATFLVHLWGPRFLWMYFILIPVGWSRVYLAKHSWLQYIGGVLLAVIWLELGFSLLGVL